MEANEASKLRRETFGQPCMHEAIVKEYDQKQETGIWVCAACGSEFAKRDIWEKIRQNQRQSLFYEAQAYK